MNGFENIKQNNIIEKEDELLNPDKEAVDLMTDTMLEYFEEGEIWEAVIMANEMVLSGIDVEKTLTEDHIQKAKNELKQLRIKLRENNNPDEYIDLARCIYRFKNLNIDFPDIDKEERAKLTDLSEYIRTNSSYPKEQLAYIPQIASAIDIDVSELKKIDDAGIVRKEIELEIDNNKGNDSQFYSMIIGGGLLAKFDFNEAKMLLESDVWKDGKKWQDIFDFFNKLKKEKCAWKFARLLPQMQALIKLKREIDKDR